MRASRSGTLPISSLSDPLPEPLSGTARSPRPADTRHENCRSYDWICSRGALIVCPLLGDTNYGIEPQCYSRNVQFGRTLVFQPGPSSARGLWTALRSVLTPRARFTATCFLHICALLMVFIMILHIRSKYTAVGRKEILIFFYMYFGEELLAIFLDSAIIPTSSPVYPVSSLSRLEPPARVLTLLCRRSQWFAALHFGLTCAIYWCLLVNGFVGFQVVEDGTRLSLWVSSPRRLRV